MSKIDFDKVLVNHIGEFGLYQKLVFLLLGCSSLTVNTQNFIHTFTGVQPKIVCLDSNSTFVNDTRNKFLQNAQTSQYRTVHINGSDNFNPIKTQINQDVIYSQVCHTGMADIVMEARMSTVSVNGSTFPDDEVHICQKTAFDNNIFESTIVTEWLLVCNEKWLSAFSQGLHMLGCFLGSVVFGHFTDSYGRKKLLLVTTFGNFAIGILCSFAPNFWLYCTLRFLVGMAISGQYNAAYVLALELVGPSYRQLAATCMLLYSSMGLMVLAGLAFYIRTWWILQIVISVPSCFLFFLYIWFVPESPRWLFTNGKYSCALTVINKMLKNNKKPCITLPELQLSSAPSLLSSKETSIKQNNIQNEVVKTNPLEPCYEKQLLNQDSDVQLKTKEKTYSILDLFRTPRIRINTVLITALWFTISTSYFGLSLYSSSLGGNIFLNLFLSGAVEVPAYLVAVYLCHRFGRRNPLAVSLVTSGVILIANMFAAKSVGASITMTLIGKLGISITFAVIYPFVTEVFPTVIRTIGLGVTSTGARVGGFTAPFVNLLEEFGKAVPLVTFGGMALFGALSVLCLPETKGTSLPETIADAEAMKPATIRCCLPKKAQKTKDPKFKESEKPEQNIMLCNKECTNI